VKVDDARVDWLKERVRIMEEVYEETAGYQTIIRRARFLATLLERKK